jgi:hypothetical protein
MINVDLSDLNGLPYIVLRAMKGSGLIQQEICDELMRRYGVKLTPSSLSRTTYMGTFSFVRLLQILEICGIESIDFKNG